MDKVHFETSGSLGILSWRIRPSICSAGNRRTTSAPP
jgi:hypothetical protein